MAKKRKSRHPSARAWLAEVKRLALRKEQLATERALYELRQKERAENTRPRPAWATPENFRTIRNVEHQTEQIENAIRAHNARERERQAAETGCRDRLQRQAYV